MQQAPPGVDARTTVAASVILYVGPAAAAVLASPLRSEPALQLVALYGALWGLFALLAPGLTALGLAGGASELTASLEGDLFTRRGALVVLDAVARDALRCAMLWTLVRGDLYFRANKQVLFDSRLRALPLAIAAGLGFGFLRGLCVVCSSASAAMAVDTISSNAGFVALAPSSVGLLVDVDACATMPLVLHHSVAYLLSLAGDVAWTALLMPLFAGALRPAATVASDDTTLSGHASSAGAAAAAAVAAADPAAERKRIRHEQIVARRARRPVVPYAMTATTATQQWALAAIAVATHLIFGTLSLLNSDAFDWTSFEVVSSRGCTAALPAQAAFVAVAIVAALYAVRAEWRPLGNSDARPHAHSQQQQQLRPDMRDDAYTRDVASTQNDVTASLPSNDDL